MTLLNELKGYHAVAVPYTPEDLRLGYKDQASYFFDKRLSRVLIDGKARVFQLHNKYLRSYTKSQQFTVRTYRDLLMSLALATSVRSVQARDTSYVDLTTQSKRYWETKGSSFWPALPTAESTPDFKVASGMYGLAGSPAFAMYLNSDDAEGLLPLEFLKRVVNYNLELYGGSGCTYEDSSKLCQETLFDVLWLGNTDSDLPVKEYQAALNKVVADGTNTPYIDVLKLVRTNLLTVNDWDSLRQRLILGEYTDLLWPVLELLQSKANEDPEFSKYYSVPRRPSNILTLYREASLNFFPPAGTPMFYQTMVLKGLVEAIDTLENIDDVLFDQDFAFLLRDEVNENWLLSAATSLATCYDAASALGMFQTLYEAKGLSYRYFLTSLQLLRWFKEPYISETGDSRLFNFTIA